MICFLRERCHFRKHMTILFGVFSVRKYTISSDICLFFTKHFCEPMFFCQSAAFRPSSQRETMCHFYPNVSHFSEQQLSAQLLESTLPPKMIRHPFFNTSLQQAYFTITRLKVLFIPMQQEKTLLQSSIVNQCQYYLMLI